jgi:hypothetical protein
MAAGEAPEANGLGSKVAILRALSARIGDGR